MTEHQSDSQHPGETAPAASTADPTADAGRPADYDGGTQETGTAGRGRPEAYAGPFTLRELVVLVSVAVMFIGSLIPFAAGPDYYQNLWTSTSIFFLALGILLPLVVAGLFAARRMTSAQPRIGSLSVDQFASVVAVLAAAFFFIVTVNVFGAASLVSLIGALGLVAATTVAPHLPFFARDFAERPETAAHMVARNAVQPAPKTPKVPKPAAEENRSGHPAPYHPGGYADQQPWGPGQPGYSADYGSSEPAPGWQNAGEQTPGGPAPAPQAGQWSQPGTAAFPAVGAPDQSAAPSQYGAAPDQSGSAPAGATEQAWERGHGQDSFGATRESAADVQQDQGETYEAFWFAVGQPRQIVDEATGAPLFSIEPGTWVLALADRGNEFLVQNTDGRVGVLRDLSNIERA